VAMDQGPQRASSPDPRRCSRLWDACQLSQPAPQITEIKERVRSAQMKAREMNRPRHISITPAVDRLPGGRLAARTQSLLCP
jgi:hypothetical protein